jgi:hypothetical protein
MFKMLIFDEHWLGCLIVKFIRSVAHFEWTLMFIVF